MTDPDRPAQVNQCIISLERLKPDMDSLTAEALCGDLYDRGVLGNDDSDDLPLEDPELEALADARANQDDLDPAVEQCVLSMKEDNPDMEKSTMIAICKDMQNKGALEAYLDGSKQDNSEAALAQFRNPGDIQRVEKDGNVVYKRVMLLSPGVWTDAGSEQTVDYTADGIRASAENFVDMEAVRKQVPEWPNLSNDQRAERLAELGDAVLADEVAVNFLHGPSMYGADSLDEVATIPTDSIIVDDRGRLYADIVMHGDTAQSVTTIDLMDEVLEAANTPGMHTPPVGPSVEIPADRVTRANGVLELQEAWFSGAGVVFNPASRPVELGMQAAERAVAMTAADGQASGLILRDASDGQTLKAALRHRWRMADDPDTDIPDFDDMSDEDLARTLETMNEDFEEIKRTLQGEDEMSEVFDLTVQYQQEGNDLQGPVTEFVAWVEENTQLTQSDMQDILDAYLQSVDADTLEATPVEGLQSWLQEMGAAGEDNGGDEEPDENPNDDEPNMEDLEAVKETLGQFADHMSDIKDMLQAAQDARTEELEDLERRLSDIEDEPQPRSLTGEQPTNSFLPDDYDGSDEEEQAEAAGPGAPSL